MQNFFNVTLSVCCITVTLLLLLRSFSMLRGAFPRRRRTHKFLRRRISALEVRVFELEQWKEEGASMQKQLNAHVEKAFSNDQTAQLVNEKIRGFKLGIIGLINAMIVSRLYEKEAIEKVVTMANDLHFHPKLNGEFVIENKSLNGETEERIAFLKP